MNGAQALVGPLQAGGGGLVLLHISEPPGPGDISDSGFFFEKKEKFHV